MPPGRLRDLRDNLENRGEMNQENYELWQKGEEIYAAMQKAIVMLKTRGISKKQVIKHLKKNVGVVEREG